MQLGLEKGGNARPMGTPLLTEGIGKPSITMV